MVLRRIDGGDGILDVHLLRAAEAAGQRLEQVRLAVLEQLDLVTGVEDVGLLAVGDAVDERLHRPGQRRAAAEDVADVLHAETQHAHRVEVGQAAGVGGDQLLAHHLDQDGVVALERGEHVGVVLVDGQQILRHVTGAAAGLAALLDGVGGVAGGGDLHRRGAGLHLALLPLLLVGRLGDVPFAGGDEAVLLVEALDDLVLQQRQRVGAGQARQQAQAVGAVLDQALLVAGHALELAAAGGVAQGDGQRGPGRRAGRGADGNAAADQRAQHGEEAAVARLDRRRVIAALVDVAEAVEQVLAGHADVVEQDRAVVDARQAALVPVVADGHARHRVAVFVADGHEDAVHAVGLGRIVVGVGGAARGVQLREHRRHAAVAGGVADVRLLRRGAGGVDDELVGLRVVRRGGLQVLHVGPVAALGHGEAAEQVQVDDLRHQVHVALAAQSLDGAAEQAPLHAGLHHHAKVRVADHFHAGQRRADFAGAAVGGAEDALGHARVAEAFQAGEDRVAGLVEG